MGFPTKIQVIKRVKSEQWYVNVPSSLAKVLELQKGETVEWKMEENYLVLIRIDNNFGGQKKKKTSENKKPV